MSEYDGYPIDVADGRGEWPNPPIIEDIEPKRLTDADLKRLAGQLDAARQQGWDFKVYMPCGVSEHRHSWRFTAWLCRLVKGD